MFPAYEVVYRRPVGGWEPLPGSVGARDTSIAVYRVQLTNGATSLREARLLSSAQAGGY